MHFKLYYTGNPGAINAYLTESGNTIATVSGLKDEKAAAKWGRKVARDHKVDNTPEATKNHVVTVAGDETFTL